MASRIKSGAGWAGPAFLALLLFAPGTPLSAKDWDLDRARYLTDLEIYLLAGPVKFVTTEYHLPGPGKMTQLLRWEFDRSGNLVEARSFTVGSSCSRQVHTYDAAGHRLKLESYYTQEQPLPLTGHYNCRFQRATEISTFAAEFDGDGRMTSRSKTLHGQSSSAVREEFKYDLEGNLVEHVWLVGPRRDLQYRNQYSYEPSSTGRKVFRHANYYVGQSAVDVRIVTTLDAKGDVLSYRKTPPQVAGYYNDYDSVYDGKGHLKRSGSKGFRTDYSGHDRHGNWTESTAYSGNTPSSIGYRTIHYYESPSK